MSKIGRKVGMGVALTMIGATALADASATLQVHSMYLYRGEDLGSGDAMVAGSLDADMSGFYVGAWAASGDSSSGQEIDFYGGYAFGNDAFEVDIGAANYYYRGSDDYDTFGAFTEAYLNLTFDMFSLGVVKNVADKAVGTNDATSFNGYMYYSAAVAVDNVTVLVGYADTGQEDVNSDGDDVTSDYTHLDVSYALPDVPGEWDDSLTFTLSKIIDQDIDRDDSIPSGDMSFREDDLIMQVAYDVTFDI